MNRKAEHVVSVEQAVDRILTVAGTDIRMALPLGLGKANLIANALYKKVQSNPQLKLTIFTALTLRPPEVSHPLAANIMRVAARRLYDGYPDLLYARDRCNNALPANVKVYEFFVSPGAFLHNSNAQQHYLNSNYTHAARDIHAQNINVVCQMVSEIQDHKVSLGCNPDVTLDLIALFETTREKPLVIGEINSRLPYLKGQAEVPETYFDILLRDSENADGYQLFTLPQRPVQNTDYALALHISTLIADGGTLQIGIGALGDAVAHMLYMRHRFNDDYKKLCRDIVSQSPTALLHEKIPADLNAFQRGLYANTEMLVEGLVFLRQKEILNKMVFPFAGLNQLLFDHKYPYVVSRTLLQLMDQNRLFSFPLNQTQYRSLQMMGFIAKDKVSANTTIMDISTLIHYCEPQFGMPLQGGYYCHAGFFVGSQMFYQAIRDFDHDSLHGLNMCAISYVNHLYGDESLKRDQRYKARFVNSGMMLTLTGAAVSDGVIGHQMVSGVGGQYNFVAQAHELEGARSILCFHSTRRKGGALKSNIVWEYSQVTIPRHLRDIVVTEYGAADLRGISDRDVIVRILNITDSAFQNELLNKAIKAGKLEPGYSIPEQFRDNKPQKLNAAFHKPAFARLLPYYPMGSDFTEVERLALHALQGLETRMQNKWKLCQFLVSNIPMLWQKNNFDEVLNLIGLNKPKTMKDRLSSFMLKCELKLIESNARPWLGSDMDNQSNTIDFQIS